MRPPSQLRAVVNLLLPLMALLTLCAEAADINCKDATTTAEMRACENRRYQKSEQELNAEYSRLIKQFDRLRAEKLRLTQRAWLVFRNLNAELLASSAQDGTLAPLIKVSALADMTEARTRELQKLEKP